MPRFISDRTNSAIKRQAKVKNPLEGAIFEGRVRDVATSGKAVVEHSTGILVFVAGAWTDELVKLKITSVKKQFAQAQLLEVLEPHPQRIQSRCEHFSATPACGGCAWPFVEYSVQLAVKQAWVEKAFARAATKKKNVVKGFAVSAIQGSAQEWGYRNRAEFKSDGEKLGFNASGSSELVDVQECPVLEPKVAAHLTFLREQLPNDAWRKPSGKIGGRAATKGSKSKQPAYTLIAADSDMSADEIRFDQRLDFRQTNDQQNEFLKNWLVETLKQCSQDKPLLELFCGAGNFTRVIAEQGFEKITGAELSATAIEALNKAALPGVSGVVANLFEEKELTKLCRQTSDAATLVLDPPREGLQCIEPLLKYNRFENIAYISCDLATCARDVERLLEAGYQLKKVQPVDMFPQTPHVELCVHVVKRG